MKKFLTMMTIAAMIAMPAAALAETIGEATAPTDIVVTDAAAESTDEALVGLANPFITCTEEEAFELIGKTFVVGAPEGFTLAECAKLSDEQLATGAAPTVRFAFGNEAGDLYRVHITTDLASLEPTEALPAIDVNGVQAIYRADESAISWNLSDCAITVDKAEATEDELKGYMAIITVAAPVEAAEAPALLPEEAEESVEEAAEAAEALTGEPIE